ncbi:MAG: bestrophin family protein [Planctomycetaceae bacterium]
MIEYDRFSWWRNTFSWRGTALPLAFPRIAIATTFCLLIEAVYELGLYERLVDAKFFQGFDPLAHTVLGSLIGFLIVFRMNASNARYWEGRSLWGQLINASRNLVRTGAEYSPRGEELAGLVAGYAICVRRNLRGFRDTEETELYVSAEVRDEAERFGNPPTAIAAAISSWIARETRLGRFDPILVRHLEAVLGQMVDAQGGCEKIQKTPLPFAYVAMIKQLIFVYLGTLPLLICPRFGWWSPLIMATVSLGMLGLEEASVEIEDPFGTHPNCLDLESYCLTITRDTAQLALAAQRRRASQRPDSDLSP